jgi:hypothetical protein
MAAAPASSTKGPLADYYALKIIFHRERQPNILNVKETKTVGDVCVHEAAKRNVSALHLQPHILCTRSDSKDLPKRLEKQNWRFIPIDRTVSITELADKGYRQDQPLVLIRTDATVPLSICQNIGWFFSMGWYHPFNPDVISPAEICLDDAPLTSVSKLG